MFWGAISIQSTKGLDSSTYLVSFSDFWFGEQSSCLGILPVFGDGILLGVNVLEDLFNRFVLLNKLDGILWSNPPRKISCNRDDQEVPCSSQWKGDKWRQTFGALDI